MRGLTDDLGYAGTTRTSIFSALSMNAPANSSGGRPS